LGSAEFLRLRLGIGRPEHSSQVVRWVLEPFTDQDMPGVVEVCAASFKGIGLLMRRGLSESTQFLNSFSWSAPTPAASEIDTTKGME
jgi:PTH1 family peptidyl-tRNA hydrolase